LGKSEDKGLMSKPVNYLFHSYDLQRESSFTHTRFLFNSPKHLWLQSGKNWRIYEALEDGTNAVKVRMAFHIHEGEASSPLRAPFGFPEIYRKIGASELTGFFSLIEADLKTRAVKRMHLKSYPEVYDRNFGLVEEALRKLQYSTTQEVSSIIPVDRKPFDKKIKISERQKLKKAEKLFSFEKVKRTRLKEIYSFIEECRNERKQSLSMSFSELKKTVLEFPKNFSFYRAYDASGTAAAAIVISVNREILYTFYYAHARRFDKVSPVVFLISGIYEMAQEQGITMIDLGTSMVKGKVNRSLLHFKKSIGGESNRKLIFEKTLV
jgi:Acetyltransferase (GNAT) domain